MYKGIRLIPRTVGQGEAKTGQNPEYRIKIFAYFFNSIEKVYFGQYVFDFFFAIKMSISTIKLISNIRFMMNLCSNVEITSLGILGF